MGAPRVREQRKRDEFAAGGKARSRRWASAGPRKGETSRSVGVGVIARPRADVGIGPYARKKGAAALFAASGGYGPAGPAKNVIFGQVVLDTACPG